MSLKIENFTEIETAVILSGFNHKYWEGDYILDDFKIPVELTLTEFAGDVGDSNGFTVDIRQGAKLFHGDEFSSAEEALKDAEFRIEDLFDNYELADDDVNEQWDKVDNF